MFDSSLAGVSPFGGTSGKQWAWYSEGDMHGQDSSRVVGHLGIYPGEGFLAWPPSGSNSSSISNSSSGVPRSGVPPTTEAEMRSWMRQTDLDGWIGR
jgi:hypothetical protein